MTTPQPDALPELIRVLVNIQGGDMHSTEAQFMSDDIGYLVRVPREWQPAALQPKPAEVSDDVGRAFYELSCDACGMSPSWGALTWGALTQNERDRQRQAATRFLALRPAQQATPEPEAGRCAQCKKAYRHGASGVGCPKCAPGVRISEAEFQQPIATPEPVGGPVGTVECYQIRGDDVVLGYLPQPLPVGTKLYTHPAPAPQQVPMTDDQVWHSDGIMSANGIAGFKLDALMRIVRAVEAHHGITAQAKGEQR